MTRVNQFAKDLGISRAAALRLLNEARATNDKGKQVMNKYMKAEKGKSVKITGPKKRPDADDRFEMEGGFDRDAYKKALKEEEKLERHMKEAPKISAKDGKYVRGMGKACMRDAKEVKIR